MVARKILIVGDDASARNELAATLARSEIQAWAVPGQPGDALSACLRQADLIVLDAPSAETGEWRLLQQVRALSSAPIIALLAADDLERTVQALDQGADQVMVWPIDGRELQARIGALLRRARSSVRGSNGSGAWSWQWAYAAASRTGHSSR